MASAASDASVTTTVRRSQSQSSVSGPSLTHAWKRQQQQNLQTLLQKLRKRQADRTSGSTATSSAKSRDSVGDSREITAALESLQSRMNLLETEREEMHRNYRVAERKFEATEAKLQAALARLGERPPLPKKEKFVPDEQQLAEQRAQQASLERLARIVLRQALQRFLQLHTRDAQVDADPCRLCQGGDQ